MKFIANLLVLVGVFYGLFGLGLLIIPEHTMPLALQLMEYLSRNNFELTIKLARIMMLDMHPVTHIGMGISATILGMWLKTY